MHWVRNGQRGEKCCAHGRHQQSITELSSCAWIHPADRWELKKSLIKLSRPLRPVSHSDSPRCSLLFIELRPTCHLTLFHKMKGQEGEMTYPPSKSLCVSQSWDYNQGFQIPSSALFPAVLSFLVSGAPLYLSRWYDPWTVLEPMTAFHHWGKELVCEIQS